MGEEEKQNPQQQPCPLSGLHEENQQSRRKSQDSQGGVWMQEPPSDDHGHWQVWRHSHPYAVPLLPSPLFAR